MREPNQSPQESNFDKYIKEMEVAHAKAKKRRRIETIVFFTILFSLFATAMYLIVWSMNKGACSDANILNEEYGTAYTCSDLLWSEDIIKEIHSK